MPTTKWLQLESNQDIWGLQCNTRTYITNRRPTISQRTFARPTWKETQLLWSVLTLECGSQGTHRRSHLLPMSIHETHNLRSCLLSQLQFEWAVRQRNGAASELDQVRQWDSEMRCFPFHPFPSGSTFLFIIILLLYTIIVIVIRLIHIYYILYIYLFNLYIYLFIIVICFFRLTFHALFDHCCSFRYPCRTLGSKSQWYGDTKALWHIIYLYTYVFTYRGPSVLPHAMAKRIFRGIYRRSWVFSQQVTLCVG